MDARAFLRRFLSGLVLAAALVVPARAQDGLYALPRLDGPVELDGFSDEAAWAAVEPLPLTTYEPVYRADPTERTEIRVAYDDHFLYVAGRLYDANPRGIRSNSMYRDRYAGDDTIALLVDTFNDNENALWFFTNPAGVRFDMAITQDGEGGGRRGPPGNISWNTFWDVATAQTDEGWFVEMRIPFSSLGFQDGGGHVEMGLSAYRFIARKNERHTFPAVPPKFRDGYRKPSLMQDVALEGVYSQKPVYVTPYATGGLGRAAELNEAETEFLIDNDVTREVGLDVKYNVTSNLTLDATFNTDFAQVEADDQQVNLTRFSLFFPEKRQFFQERAGIFEFETGRSDRLFYTRRIGLNEEEPVRILGGGRLTGRVGDWDVGLINMQTARQADTSPAENFGVARLRRQVLNPYSYAGGIATTRLGADGTYNLAYGLDGVFRLTGDEYLTVQWAQTFDDAVIDTMGLDFFNAGFARAEWERRREVGFNYRVGFTYAGRDYVPDMGFVRRIDYTEFSPRLSYGQLMGPASPVRLRRLSLFNTTTVRNGDGALDSAFLGAFLTFEMKNGAELSISPRFRVENLPEPIEFPDDVVVPAERFTFLEVEGRYQMSRGRLFRVETDFEGGQFYDGRRFTFRATPTWIASTHLELAAEYEGNFVAFPDRDQAFDAHIVRLRTQAALNKQVSASAFVQYSDVAHGVTTNLRFRYNFREGNDLWLVYNEGLNTDRYRETPIRPVTDNRALLVKYTYTFDV